MLEIKNIYKTFNAGTVNEKRALKGVNLTLEDGDFVTVIGGNGAGKSTLLNAIAGVWPVDEGEIIIDGKNVTKLPEHKRAAYLGRVFQDPMNGTAAIAGCTRPTPRHTATTLPKGLSLKAERTVTLPFSSRVGSMKTSNTLPISWMLSAFVCPQRRCPLTSASIRRIPISYGKPTLRSPNSMRHGEDVIMARRGWSRFL